MMPAPLRRLSPLLALLVLPAPLAAGPVATPPAAQSFTLGGIAFTALRDADNVVPNDGSVFGVDVGPAAVAKTLAAAGAPTDTITLGVDALLVRLPGRIVLIDTGLGPKVNGALVRSLAAAGVAPAQVTDILITHSHGDHVGGLLAADGTLAFPKATIRLSAAEWQFLRDKGNAALARAIAPQVQPFTPGGFVVPGIRAVALPGHTPGHTTYEIGGNNARLVDIGDSAHSAIVSLAQPEWTIRYDTDAAQGKAARRAELTKLAQSRAWVFAPHFPFPGVGHIVAKGPGFAFVPGLPGPR